MVKRKLSETSIYLACNKKHGCFNEVCMYYIGLAKPKTVAHHLARRLVERKKPDTFECVHRDNQVVRVTAAPLASSKKTDNCISIW